MTVLPSRIGARVVIVLKALKKARRRNRRGRRRCSRVERRTARACQRVSGEAGQGTLIDRPRGTGHLNGNPVEKQHGRRCQRGMGAGKAKHAVGASGTIGGRSGQLRYDLIAVPAQLESNRLVASRRGSCKSADGDQQTLHRNRVGQQHAQHAAPERRGLAVAAEGTTAHARILSTASSGPEAVSQALNK